MWPDDASPAEERVSPTNDGWQIQFGTEATWIGREGNRTKDAKLAINHINVGPDGGFAWSDSDILHRDSSSGQWVTVLDGVELVTATAAPPLIFAQAARYDVWVQTPSGLQLFMGILESGDYSITFGEDHLTAEGPAGTVGRWPREALNHDVIQVNSYGNQAELELRSPATGE